MSKSCLCSGHQFCVSHKLLCFKNDDSHSFLIILLIVDYNKLPNWIMLVNSYINILHKLHAIHHIATDTLASYKNVYLSIFNCGPNETSFQQMSAAHA